MAYIQQLLKGLIDPILLSVINELPTYGYQIVKELEQKTEGYLRLKAGTVYPALIRLEKKGLLTSRWEQTTERQGRRYYQITEKGRQFLASRSDDWHDFCAVMNQLVPMPSTDSG
jgi:PadR family transcriptional regulator PadR